jgi:hypothetical protein
MGRLKLAARFDFVVWRATMRLCLGAHASPNPKCKPLKRRDENQAAFDAVQPIIAAGDGGKNPLAVALGGLGDSRAATPERPL